MRLDVKKYILLKKEIKKQEEQLAEIKAMLQEVLSLLRGKPEIEDVKEENKAEEPEQPNQPENPQPEQPEEKEKAEGIPSPAPETTVESEPTEPNPEQKKKPIQEDQNKEVEVNLEKSQKVEAPRVEVAKNEEMVNAKEEYGVNEVLKELSKALETGKVPTIKEITNKLRLIRK